MNLVNVVVLTYGAFEPRKYSKNVLVYCGSFLIVLDGA